LMLHPALGKYNYSGICKRSGTAQGCAKIPPRPIGLGRCGMPGAAYFCVGGVAGLGAGAGWVLTGCDFTPWSTEFEPLRREA